MRVKDNFHPHRRFLRHTRQNEEAAENAERIRIRITDQVEFEG